MLISDIIQKREVSLSLEVFPPKKQSSYASVEAAVDELRGLGPDFMSVTYGAGGGTSKNTIGIAAHIQNDLGGTALAHLTCASSTKEEIREIIARLKNSGIQNVLALRGDIPQDLPFPAPGHFHNAWELVEEIKKAGDFCIAAACYPEGHVESVNKETDMDHLKAKVECGCSFLVTQMFFDNNVLYSFLYNLARKGINVPVLAGIMPITRISQIQKTFSLSGATLTPKFKAMVDKFGQNPAAMKQAGIAYATEQIIDLVTNGVRGIHLYTMNRPDVARGILGNISDIISR
jgi:methylenetetrahydrofolate reductase (NADPH)